MRRGERPVTSAVRPFPVSPAPRGGPTQAGGLAGTVGAPLRHERTQGVRMFPPRYYRKNAWRDSWARWMKVPTPT